MSKRRWRRRRRRKPDRPAKAGDRSRRGCGCLSVRVCSVPSESSLHNAHVSRSSFLIIVRDAHILRRTILRWILFLFRFAAKLIVVTTMTVVAMAAAAAAAAAMHARIGVKKRWSARASGLRDSLTHSHGEPWWELMGTRRMSISFGCADECVCVYLVRFIVWEIIAHRLELYASQLREQKSPTGWEDGKQKKTRKLCAQRNE